jgi:glucose-1-phosphate adenylyltransferase
MKNVVTLILGGGRGTRLYPLTKYRSKPAVPLGGKYRLIDIPLSNCIHSGINQMFVLTQFLSVSLHRHIRQTYRFDRFDGGFVELLAAQQTMDAGTNWYEGTADAVRKNLRYLEESSAEYVLILSGDQLYRMDYRDLIATHEEKKADVTIAGLPVARKEASQLGIMKLDDSGRVLGFVEKPKTPEALAPVVMDRGWFERQGISSEGRELIANMGIYLFNRRLLVDVLRQTTSEDFGKEIFPRTVASHRVQLHMFDEYWEDIGTIGAFYEANLAMTQPNPPFPLVAPQAPLYTRARFLPPARIHDATITNSLISDGCDIGPGSVIENSIIGIRCKIGPNVTIRNSIVFGDDDMEVVEVPEGRSIGSGSVIEGAIVDKNARIGRNVRLVREGDLVDGEDRDDCMIRDGIPIVLRGAILADNWTFPNG